MSDQLLKDYQSSKNAQTYVATLKALQTSAPSSVANLLKPIAMDLEKLSNPELVSLGNELLGAGLLGSPGLDEETYKICKELFDIYVARGDFQTAVNFLSKAPLLKDEFKVDQHERFQGILNLVTANLEIKQSLACEPVLMKAHEMASKIKDKDLLIQYNYCCGEYYNFSRKYLTAAMRYYSACNIESITLDGDAISNMLSKAIDTAILAPTGPKKRFLVANLMKDERAKAFKNYQLLLKINKEAVVSANEVEQFCTGLKTHQNMRDKDGFTAAEKVFLEHNIIVLSKVYRDITLESLSDRLGVRTNEVERILQDMCGGEKLALQIDHLTGSVRFSSSQSYGETSKQSLGIFCELLDNLKI